MKKVHLSTTRNFWFNTLIFFSYSYSERVVIKVLNRSFNLITRQATIGIIREFHYKNPDLLSSFALGIIKTFEDVSDNVYSELPGLVMSKIGCNYKILKVDPEAKRAGEIYAECFLDKTSANYIPATQYIVKRIKET